MPLARYIRGLGHWALGRDSRGSISDAENTTYLLSSSYRYRCFRQLLTAFIIIKGAEDVFHDSGQQTSLGYWPTTSEIVVHQNQSSILTKQLATGHHFYLEKPALDILIRGGAQSTILIFGYHCSKSKIPQYQVAPYQPKSIARALCGDGKKAFLRRRLTGRSFAIDYSLLPWCRWLREVDLPINVVAGP